MMSSNNIRMFARTPLATAAEFAKSEWLDLALATKIGDQQSDQFAWLHLEKKSAPRTPVGAVGPVVQVAVKPVATSFPLFHQLAVELQNKIWIMESFNYPRIVAIVEEDVDVTIHPNDDQYTVHGARRPRFLNSCRGALSAMVGVYRPMFELDPAKYHGDKKGIFINPDIDRIHFVSHLFLRGQAPPLNFIGALRYRGEFAMIRHVCLPVQEFHGNFQTLAQMIQSMPLLESTVVEANEVDITLNHTISMQFMFQDVHYCRPNRQRRSDMVIMVWNGRIPLIGLPAIDVIFNTITNPTHRAGILETLGRVETMMRQESNFPDRVLGVFNYRNH